MYSPPHFQESRPEVLAGLIQRYPLGCVTTMTPDGLVADHIPLLFEPGAEAAGKLIGHVARANPVWQSAPDQPFLVFSRCANRLYRKAFGTHCWH